jgi:hypothetical protein
LREEFAETFNGLNLVEAATEFSFPTSLSQKQNPIWLTQSQVSCLSLYHKLHFPIGYLMITGSQGCSTSHFGFSAYSQVENPYIKSGERYYCFKRHRGSKKLDKCLLFRITSGQFFSINTDYVCLPRINLSIIHQPSLKTSKPGRGNTVPGARDIETNGKLG